MEFDKVFTVKKEHSKEQFLRAAMIKLASNIETPLDVVKADFGEVKESVKEVIKCSAHVESDYTASIGYDRQEQYQTTESKRLSAGDLYTQNGIQKRADYDGSFRVDVVKTRTVTDWQPYSGHIGGDATCVAMNGSEKYSYSRICTVLESTKDESIIEKGKAVVSPVGLEEVKGNCQSAVESKIRFPGDHCKDIHSNASVEINAIECWILPFYEAEYTYKGKKYKISDYACGDFDVEAECPPNDVDIVAIASKETESSQIVKIIGWILFGLTYAVSCVLFAVNVYWMWAVTAAVLGIAITLHVVSDKKFFAKVKSLTEDNVVLKRKELENVLAHNGYEKLTSSEIGMFNAESKGTSYAYDNMRKGVKVPAILCFIATFLLMMVSIAINI